MWDWIRHVRHVTELVGAERAAIGTDHIDVGSLPQPLPEDTFMVPFRGPKSSRLFHEVLQTAGYSDHASKQALGQRAARVAGGTLGKCNLLSKALRDHQPNGDRSRLPAAEGLRGLRID